MYGLNNKTLPKSYIILLTFVAFVMLINLLYSMTFMYNNSMFNYHIVSASNASIRYFPVSIKPDNKYLSISPEIQSGNMQSKKKGGLNGPENITQTTRPEISPEIHSRNMQSKKKGGLNGSENITQTTRPDNCTNCFQHNFKDIVTNNAICDERGGIVVKLFIFILTVHNNTIQRNTLRNTWLSVSNNNTSNVRYVFLLGKSKDEAMNRKAIAEAAIFNDIIMEDFTDSYQNLTHKTIMGLKYVSNYCKQTKYVFKTDDDMWINIPALQDSIETFGQTLQAAIGGYCFVKSALPIRDKKSKWYASFSTYPGKHYPGFCSGTGYVTSSNVIQKIFETSKHVPFFHLEDVYMSLCAKKLGIKLILIPGFYAPLLKNNLCFMKSNRCITSHYVPRIYLKKIWNTKC